MKLKTDEVAQCLNLPPSTIERWIRQGRIPMRKHGTDCIFKRSALEKWAEAHNLSFSPQEEDVRQKQDARPETLLSVMKRGGVFHSIKGDDVTDVLKSAASSIPFLPADDQKELLGRLLEREHLTSTGVGKGVAIPHPRSPLSHKIVHPSVTTCFLEKPVDFSSIDDRPVFVMFILLSPSTRLHLHFLSRLAFCVRDNTFVEFLKTSPDSAELFSKIADFEKQLSIED